MQECPASCVNGKPALLQYKQGYQDTHTMPESQIYQMVYFKSITYFKSIRRKLSVERNCTNNPALHVRVLWPVIIMRAFLLSLGSTGLLIVFLVLIKEIRPQLEARNGAGKFQVPERIGQ